MDHSEIKITKEEHIWTSDEKLKWLGYGEWVEEYDGIEFEYFGISCIITRVLKREPYAKEEAYFGGHFCGYVRIPEEHLYFRKEDIDLDCHGGITFNQIHEEHWIGFDCAHSADYIPSMQLIRKTMPELIELRKMFPIPEDLKNHPWDNPIYRNMEYCIKECKRMIEQLVNLDKNTYNKRAESIKDFEGKV